MTSRTEFPEYVATRLASADSGRQMMADLAIAFASLAALIALGCA
jgi:hypothetical protein